MEFWEMCFLGRNMVFRRFYQILVHPIYGQSFTI